ncbi:MAG: S1 RNA-binding domain-containing protein [Clostridia bacterium]|nr:S1 RNA-binding domain-containing protein [Clostridia bacterium]
MTTELKNEAMENNESVLNTEDVNESVPEATEESVDTTEKAVDEVTEEKDESDGSIFAEAVEKMPKKYIPLRVGQKIKGTVTHIAEDGVSVSIGSKRDGFIPNADLSLDPDYQSVKDAMKIGDTIDVMTLSTEKQVLLSAKKIAEIRLADAQVDEIKEGAEFSVQVQRAVKGGLISKLGSFIVFVPASQIRNGFVKNLDQYVDKKLRLVALDVDLSKKKIVGSQKELMNREKKAKEDYFWNNIEVGEIVEGRVLRFAPFGAFVNVRGYDCLAHLSDLSWLPIKEPSEVLELQKTYNFLVLKLDREANRVSIGYKQLQKHPWELAAEKFQVGTVCEGKVARLTTYGAFIELDKGIDGLLHISNVSWDWISDLGKILTVGETISVQVMEFDAENKRITLSRKATIEQPVIAQEVEGEQAEATAENEHKVATSDDGEAKMVASSSDEPDVEVAEESK